MRLASRFHDEAVRRGVPVSQCAAFQRHPHRLRFARLQRDPLEPAQLFKGPLYGGSRCLTYICTDLIARALPGVLDIHANRNLSRAVHRIRRGAQIRILELGVAEAESERIQRLRLEVEIGAAFADVIVHHGGRIVQRLDPRSREASARIVVAKQYVGQRIALFLAVVRHMRMAGHSPVPK